MANKSAFGSWFGALLGSAVGVLGGCAGGDESRGDDTFATGSTSADVPSDSGSDEGGVCVPGMQSSCACPGGIDGVQVCNGDGSGFDSCECPQGTGDDGPSDDTTGDGTTGEPEPCGNGTCDADEDCNTCEMDCGVCEPCTAAPSCEGAEIPPVIETHADFLDDPMAYKPPPEIMGELAAHVDAADPAARLIAAALSDPQAGEPALVAALRDAFAAHPGATAAIRRQLAAAGMSDPSAYGALHPVPSVTELAALSGSAAHAAGVSAIADPTEPFAAPCDDPRMRIRVARLDVHEEDDDFANDEVYCAITAEAAEAGELKITPITPALDEGDSHTYNLDAGLVWGQSELAAPKGNLLLAYNCIESDTANGYTDLLMAVADAANAAGGVDIPGVDGWVFPAVGIVSNLLAGALSLDGDDLLFNGTQVVPETEMINLTHGAWWSVRRNGTNLNSDWDWELRMEIWGCHDNGTG
jgi:hypothetical protein